MAAETPLMNAIREGRTMEALEIIASGQGELGAICDGQTALYMACDGVYDEAIALAIIATGQGYPGHVVGNKSILMVTSQIALVNALLATGESNPGFVGTDGNTALIEACHTGNDTIALALIASGESRPETLNAYGWDAIAFARVRQGMYPAMAEVVAVLDALVIL
jgi:ankyrin repeat protein